MDKVLIAYATNSGGTLVVSELMQKTLKEKGVEVLLKDIRDVKRETLPDYSLIIFGSPSWNYNDQEGQPHEFFTKFMDESQGVVLKKVAVFGLGDTAYIHFCGAVDIITEFAKKNGAEIVIEPLRIDGFFFKQPENEKQVLNWLDILVSENSDQKTIQN